MTYYITKVRMRWLWVCSPLLGYLLHNCHSRTFIAANHELLCSTAPEKVLRWSAEVLQSYLILYSAGSDLQQHTPLHFMFFFTSPLMLMWSTRTYKHMWPKRSLQSSRNFIWLIHKKHKYTCNSTDVNNHCDLRLLQGGLKEKGPSCSCWCVKPRGLSWSSFLFRLLCLEIKGYVEFIKATLIYLPGVPQGNICDPLQLSLYSFFFYQTYQWRWSDTW